MDGMIVHSTINICQTPANEFTYRLAWRIRCCSSRCRIFIEPLKNFHNWWITFVTTPQIIDTSQSPTIKSGLFGLSAVSVNWPSTSDNLFTVISQLIAAITTLPTFGSMLLSTIKMSPSLMWGSIDWPETRQKKVAISLVISSSLRSIFSADSPNGG